MRPQLCDIGFGCTRSGHHGDRIPGDHPEQDKGYGDCTYQRRQGQQQAVEQVGVTHQGGVVFTPSTREKS